MTYTLYVAAFAGAGITVLALVSDLPLLLFRGWRGSCDAVPPAVEAVRHPWPPPMLTGEHFALCSDVSANANIIIPQ